MTEPNPNLIDLPKQFNPNASSSTERIVYSPEQIRSFPEAIQNKLLESPEDRAARINIETKKLDAQLEQQRYDASFNRKKEIGLVFVLIVVISFSLFICFQVVNSDKASEDIKKAAVAAISAVLTSTISGIGAYIAGTKSAKSQ
jgi:hypothetical protein